MHVKIIFKNISEQNFNNISKLFNTSLNQMVIFAKKDDNDYIFLPLNSNSNVIGSLLVNFSNIALGSNHR